MTQFVKENHDEIKLLEFTKDLKRDQKARHHNKPGGMNKKTRNTLLGIDSSKRLDFLLNLNPTTEENESSSEDSDENQGL